MRFTLFSSCHGVYIMLLRIAGLQCYICDSTSYVSYSDAETECNTASLRRCPDTKVKESIHVVFLRININKVT